MIFGRQMCTESCSSLSVLRSCVGYRAYLNAISKTKIPAPVGNRIPDVQYTTNHLAVRDIPTCKKYIIHAF